MTKTITKKIVDLLWTSVHFESGDGDAIWLSKHIPLKVIKEIIEEYSEENNIGWVLEEKEDHLLWGEREEYVIITNSKDFYSSNSDWVVLKIEY